jgi:hypothetical protein
MDGTLEIIRISNHIFHKQSNRQSVQVHVH